MNTIFQTIPPGWSRSSLKYLCKGPTNGAWGEEAGDSEKDAICVRVADFDWSHLAITICEPTTRSFKKQQFANLQLNNGDVLIEKSGGGAKTPVGRVVAFEEHIDAVTSNFVARIRPNDKVDNRYFLYLLAAQYMSGYSHQFIKQNTGIQNLDDTQLFRSDVWLPGIPQQQQIADFLDRETARVDQLIEKKTRLIQLLDEKQKADCSWLVTNGIDETIDKIETGVEWLPKAPSHWRIQRISTIFTESTEMGCDELPVLSVSINWGISDRELTDDDRHRIVNHIEDKSSYKRVRPGDLVYNMMRAWQGAFGVAKVDGLVSPAYVVARPKEEIHSLYFEPLLRTQACIEEFRRASKGIADFRQRLYWEHFRQVHVALPPIEEQKMIAERVSVLSDKIANAIAPIEKSIDRLREYRSALITAAVTGQIDITTWGKSGAVDRQLDAIQDEMGAA